MTKMSSPKTIYYYYLIPGIIGVFLGLSTAYVIYARWIKYPVSIFLPDHTTELTISLIIVLGCTSLNLICLTKIYQLVWHQRRESQKLKPQPLDLLSPAHLVQIYRQQVSGLGQGSTVSQKMDDRREAFEQRKDSAEFAAEASISRLNLDGEIIYAVILHDVDERKQLEKMKDEFVTMVSHELRTPVTSVHGVLNLLVNDLVDVSSEKGQQLLQIAAKSTDQLVHLINDIVDIEKIDTAPSRLPLTSCNVKDLLQKAIQSLQSYAHEAGIKLSLDITNDGAPLIILANYDQLVQVLINLINNAIQFSPPDGIVRLAAERWGSQVKFCISDQGQGIPLEKQEMVFERFQQVDSSTTRHHEGAGLGLTVCRRIVHQYQGEIWLKSTVGQGTTFYFTIPAAPAPPAM